MQLNLDGIVLSQRSFGEDDCLLKILTADRGVISAYAGGAKKMKSRLSTSCDQLCFSHFILFYNRERYTVNAADPIRIFFGIRQDIEKLSLASYFCELCLEFAREGENTQEYYSLFLNCMHLLDKSLRPLPLVKAAFELRMLSFSGYLPDLVACQSCGCYEAPMMQFLLETGQLLCQDCAGADLRGRIPLSGGVLAAMRHIIYSEPKKVFDFSLSDDGLKQLNRASEGYLLHKLEKNLKTLDFYHTLQPL